MRQSFFAWLVLAVVAGHGFAQAPTGTISGTITDASGSVVPGASLTITNKDSGEIRHAVTSGDGTYAVASLPAGQYDVSAEAPGFRTVVRNATVTVGSTVKVDLALVVGDTKDVVTVEAVTAQMNYESQTVQGVVSRGQIQELPLNGRSFLNLAVLEPGVTITTGSTAQYNSLFRVQILGTSGAGQSGLAGPQPAITVDGASVRDSVTGQTGMNFSQEVPGLHCKLRSLHRDHGRGRRQYRSPDPEATNITAVATFSFEITTSQPIQGCSEAI